MAKKRGRPRRPEREVRFVITLRLREGPDDDLIRLLSNTPRGLRATVVKQALRFGPQQVQAVVEEALEEFDEAVDDFLL